MELENLLNLSILFKKIKNVLLHINNILKCHIIDFANIIPKNKVINFSFNSKPKILFLSSGCKADYMCDMFYHGLKSNIYYHVEEINPMRFMYSSYKKKNSLYGNGFTIYCQLPNEPICIDRWSMMSRIRKKYYDNIVFGSIWRYNKYFEIISEIYEKNKIIIIDGEDHQELRNDFIDYGIYYKREIDIINDKINPINFSIPEDKILNFIPPKTKRLAHIIPGKLDTYIFNIEENYYFDYQKSIFGVTMKKAGWDCLRHYEILMNGCIPYFIGLNNCPQNTMIKFPKEIIKSTNEFYDNTIEFNHNNYITELLDFTRKNLTTKKLVDSIFKR